MKQRIQLLDMVRGFALIGILYANIPSLAHVAFLDLVGIGRELQLLLDYGFEQRFFPIFSFLFGVGFYIFTRNAIQKGLHVRRLFARRLLVLIGFGALHQFLQPGETLLIYGIFGLCLLPFAIASVPVLLLASGGVLLGGLAITEYFVGVHLCRADRHQSSVATPVCLWAT